MTNKTTAVFEPFGWQIAPWRDKSPVMLLTGSSNGGKSRLAAEKVHGFLLKYPGSTALLLRKAREFAVSSIVPMMQSVIGDDPTVHYVNRMFEYDNGSRAYIGGMKDRQQREAIRSMRGKFGEPDITLMEEANAFTRSDLAEADIRTRGKVAGWNQVILVTNPDHPQHWIHTDLIVGGGAAVYYSSIDDNQNATQADRDRLDRLTGVQRLRLRDGKWVRAEGVVYDEFDTNIHVIDPFPIPHDWLIYRAIDFGYNNPFVCQWWAMDGDGNLYLYKEIHQRQRLVEDLARIISSLTSGRLVQATVTDHDAEDRATLNRYGIPTTPAHKDVRLGIDAVKSRLRVQPNGKPRLFIFRDALVNENNQPIDDERGESMSLKTEMLSYSWQEPKENQAAKEEPVKLNDHHEDAARYLVVHVDGYNNSAVKYQPLGISRWQSAVINNNSRDDVEVEEDRIESRWKRY